MCEKLERRSSPASVLLVESASMLRLTFSVKFVSLNTYTRHKAMAPLTRRQRALQAEEAILQEAEEEIRRHNFALELAQEMGIASPSSKPGFGDMYNRLVAGGINSPSPPAVETDFAELAPKSLLEAVPIQPEAKEVLHNAPREETAPLHAEPRVEDYAHLDDKSTHPNKKQFFARKAWRFTDEGSSIDSLEKYRQATYM